MSVCERERESLYEHYTYITTVLIKFIIPIGNYYVFNLQAKQINLLTKAKASPNTKGVIKPVMQKKSWH